MKIALFVVTMVVAIMVSAQSKESSKEAIKEPDLDFFKHEAIARIDQRMALLAAAKTCIEAATDRPALKECHKSLNEDRREIQEEFKKDRKMKKMKADK